MHKFKALDNDSQMCSGGNVLFFDENARPSDLFECASYRIEAVAKLHNELSFVYTDKINNAPISDLTSIVLSDAVSMLRASYSNTRELEIARKEIDQYKKTVATLSRELAAKCDDTTKEGE
ncbi:hypothetical protein ACFMMZ_004117 [Salmonella enterica]|nr:hypothetical protein [Salmonella enterica]ECW2126624.1 hypothetical protein [Salmonella enterica]